MRWNLRAAALDRGITTAVELRRRLAARGLVISVGKMSALWSGEPITIRLGDLGVICAVLACTPNDLLLPAADSSQELRPRRRTGHGATL